MGHTSVQPAVCQIEQLDVVLMVHSAVHKPTDLVIQRVHTLSDLADLVLGLLIQHSRVALGLIEPVVETLI